MPYCRNNHLPIIYEEIEDECPLCAAFEKIAAATNRPVPQVCSKDLLNANCKWHIPDGYDDIYFTGCGKNMMFDYKTPTELEMKFCPWCAGKISI
jgi:hypothetical protein